MFLVGFWYVHFVFLVGSWWGFPVQALPLQVPESPERSERLEVFFDSRRLTRGGGFRKASSAARAGGVESFSLD